MAGEQDKATSVEEAPAVEAEVEEVEAIIEEEPNEKDEPESVEQSTRKALEELKAEKRESSGSEGEVEKESKEVFNDKPVQELEKSSAKEAKPKTPKKEVEFEEDDEPPSRLRPNEQEWFKQIPQKGLKKAINRTLKELQALGTKNAQEVAREREEIRSLKETINPYVDVFTERNLTAPQAIGQLLLAQKRLTDPETRDETYVNIGVDVQPSEKAWKILGQKLGYANFSEGEQGGDIPDISSHPYVKKLEERINSLTEKVEPEYNSRVEASQREYETAKNTYLEQLVGVQQEIDAQGNYVRPELMRDNNFLENWKLWVSTLVKTKNLSYGDAGKEAYSLLKGKSSTNGSQPKLPGSGNQLNKRAVTAAVSIRGKSAPLTNGYREIPVEVPAFETPEQSTRAALAELRSRRG